MGERNYLSYKFSGKFEGLMLKNFQEKYKPLPFRNNKLVDIKMTNQTQEYQDSSFQLLEQENSSQIFPSIYSKELQIQQQSPNKNYSNITAIDWFNFSCSPKKSRSKKPYRANSKLQQLYVIPSFQRKLKYFTYCKSKKWIEKKISLLKQDEVDQTKISIVNYLNHKSFHVIALCIQGVIRLIRCLRQRSQTIKLIISTRFKKRWNKYQKTFSKIFSEILSKTMENLSNCDDECLANLTGKFCSLDIMSLSKFPSKSTLKQKFQYSVYFNLIINMFQNLIQQVNAYEELLVSQKNQLSFQKQFKEEFLDYYLKEKSIIINEFHSLFVLKRIPCSEISGTKLNLSKIQKQLIVGEIFLVKIIIENCLFFFSSKQNKLFYVASVILHAYKVHFSLCEIYSGNKSQPLELRVFYDTDANRYGICQEKQLKNGNERILIGLLKDIQIERTYYLQSNLFIQLISTMKTFFQTLLI